MTTLGQKKVYDRIENEKEFHDRRFESEMDYIKERSAPFYAIARRSFSTYRNHVLSLVENMSIKVLEYGCGDGSLAFELASKGADVIGIDISGVAVDKAKKRAAELVGIQGSLRFEVMNAEALTFEEGSFDLVCGSAILHHLDIEKSYQQIARVLTPKGMAVFLEPLGHNPLINFYRRLTPELRTPDEHPLLVKDINFGKKIFKSVQAEYLNLLTLMALPFTKRSSFPKILSLLECLENYLFEAIPFVGRLAWTVVLKLRK